jgi:hypothetical protein
VDNRVTTATVGFVCGGGPTSKVYLRDNIVVSTPQPYGSACNSIGATNYP